MARNRQHKAIQKSYAIIGEGITEYFYFDGLRNYEKDLLKKYNITLKPDKPKHPDYKDIVNKAKVLIEKEFDVVFCLIDMDYISTDAVRKLSYAKEKAKCIKQYGNSIWFIESNPAFELWLLLHFLYSDRVFRNCEEIVSELKKSGRLENYTKSQDYFIRNELYCQLKNRLDTAMKHSKQLEEKRNNSLAQSYTDIYKVIEELFYR